MVAGLGTDMRHPWAEITEMPYSGALDEFLRKKARNDYPLLALWEMGVKRLRLPWHDLMDDRIRERMAALKKMGHLFYLFVYDLPTPGCQRRLNVIVTCSKVLKSSCPGEKRLNISIN